LQKRPIILRSLPIEATPYRVYTECSRLTIRYKIVGNGLEDGLVRKQRTFRHAFRHSTWHTGKEHRVPKWHTINMAYHAIGIRIDILIHPPSVEEHRQNGILSSYAILAYEEELKIYMYIRYIRHTGIYGMRYIRYIRYIRHTFFASMPHTYRDIHMVIYISVYTVYTVYTAYLVCQYASYAKMARLPWLVCMPSYARLVCYFGRPS